MLSLPFGTPDSAHGLRSGCKFNDIGDEQMAGDQQVEKYAKVEVGGRIGMAMDADKDAIFLEILDHEAEVHYNCQISNHQRATTMAELIFRASRRLHQGRLDRCGGGAYSGQVP